MMAMNAVLLCVCRGAALLQLLCGYAERFGALLQGHSEDMPLSELMGGARIRHIFQVRYSVMLLIISSTVLSVRVTASCWRCLWVCRFHCIMPSWV
jgi:hypothetical protein